MIPFTIWCNTYLPVYFLSVSGQSVNHERGGVRTAQNSVQQVVELREWTRGSPAIALTWILTQAPCSLRAASFSSHSFQVSLAVTCHHIQISSPLPLHFSTVSLLCISSISPHPPMVPYFTFKSLLSKFPCSIQFFMLSCQPLILVKPNNCMFVPVLMNLVVW